MLEYLNGTREYFDGTYGHIIKHSDRFGNEIDFEYTTIDNFRYLSRISDNAGRVIDINYEYIGNHQKKVEIKIGEDIYSTLILTELYNKYEVASVISSITDGEGLTTSFEYQEMPVVFCFGYAVDADNITYGSSFPMTKVTYPTTGASEYTYSKERRAYTFEIFEGSAPHWSWYEVYKVVGCKQYDDYEIEYEYENDYSGYPLSHPESEPYDNPTGNIVDSNVQYKTTVKQNGNTTVHIFDYKHTKIKEQSFDNREQTPVIHQTVNEYNSHKQLISSTKSVIKGNEEKTLGTESITYYDDLNVVESTTDMQGNKTEYTYMMDEYFIPDFITMYAGTENQLTVSNTLSAGNDRIEDCYISYSDRAVLTEYIYDNVYSHNVINEKSYEIKDGVQTLIGEKVYEYDDYGLFVTKEKLVGVETNDGNFEVSSAEDIVLEYEYDIFGNLISETNASGETVSHTYDKNNRLMKTTYPDGTYVETTYDIDNDSNIITSYNGEYEEVKNYDRWGRLESHFQRGNGITDSFVSYIYLGNRLDIAFDGNDNRTYYSFDAFDRVISMNTLNADETEGFGKSVEYDDFNLTAEVSQGGKKKKMYYDNFGRLIREEQNTAAGLNFVTYEYDYRNNLVKTTDANGNSVTNTYNDENQLVCTTNQLGQQTLYEYDRMGNVSKVTYSGGSYVLYEYDTAGRLIKETDALGNSKYSVYDANGNVILFKDKNGHITQNTYDIMNRLTKTQSGDIETSYTYGTLGEVLTMTDQTGTTNYSYTQNNRLSGITTPDNKSISYVYDSMGNVISVNDYDGNTVEYTYNAVNNIDTISQNGTVLADYDYTDFGAIEKISYPDTQIETVYEYDDAMRITRKATMRYWDTGTFNDVMYTYDVLGNQIEMFNALEQKRTTYTYDALGRLTSETAPDGVVTKYVFDAGNNIMKKDISYPSHHTFKFIQGGTEYSLSKISMHSHTYAYNKANQLLMETESVMGTSSDYSGYLEITKEYTYDKNGNMLKKETGGQSDKSVVEYTYNRLNQLTTFKGADGTITNYGYDGTGMRVSKTQGDVTRKYYWDRGYVSNEGIGNEIVATNYIGTQGIFARNEGSNLDYFHKNAHGDIATITRGENKIRGYNYDAYGNQRSEDTLFDDITGEELPSTEDFNPIRYSGEYFDEESGLIYLRNRYYDPSIGRFINEDPIKDGTNWYAYCGNNPVMFVDPWGLYSLEVDDKGNVYAIIEYGDTLSGIAFDQVGDASAWQKIGYEGDPTKIQIGEKININNIYNINYPRPIEYNHFYNISIGDYTIKVALEKDIIRTSLIEGDAKELLLESSQNAVIMALIEKEFYKDVFGENIDIADISLAVELLGHVYPQKWLAFFGLHKNITNANVVDAGVLSVDTNRYIWDKISMKMSFDEYVDMFYSKY